MKKSSDMYLVILGFWLITLLYFNLKLLALLVGPEGLIAKISVVLFVGCLNLFWFYGIYHVVVPLYSRYGFKHNTTHPKTTDYNPPVAILYTTRNDFQEQAALSCIQQDYSNYHLFICDDSPEPGVKEQIDQFKKNHPDLVTIIRRSHHKGYKAGNINHCVNKIKKNYPYFAITDADGILPRNFISGLISYFKDSPHLAFVQANQRSNPKQKSRFAQVLAYNTDLHWSYYVPAKEKYGFTMFYGHGAIIRTSIWEELGGLPEIATEDLSFSMRLRRKGYYGIFAPEITCYEDFPAQYSQFRRRNEKWIKGTTESLAKDYLPFLKSISIPWFEKLDVLVSSLSLLIATPFSLFLILVTLLLPIFYGLFRFNGPLIITPIYVTQSWLTYLLSIRYNVFWTWDLLLIMILMIFGPQFPVIMGLWKRPKRMLRYMAVVNFSYLSIIVVSAINLFSYFFTRKAPFPVTGDRTLPKTILGTNSPCIIIAEILIGMAILFFTIKNMNIWLGSIGLALLSGPLLLKGKYWRPLIYIPFAVTVFIVILIGYSIFL